MYFCHYLVEINEIIKTKDCMCAQCIRLFVNPWTVACQTPLSMEFLSMEIVKTKDSMCAQCIRLFVNPWTVACQTPLSMVFPGKDTRVAMNR